MLPDFPSRGSVRSAAVVNAEIRALWLRLDGRPTSPGERREYERLVVEWATAVRVESAVADAA
jgi:hypothetical protein